MLQVNICKNLKTFKQIKQIKHKKFKEYKEVKMNEINHCYKYALALSVNEIRKDKFILNAISKI